jgi:hypothetical protein
MRSLSVQCETTVQTMRRPMVEQLMYNKLEEIWKKAVIS